MSSRTRHSIRAARHVAVLLTVMVGGWPSSPAVARQSTGADTVSPGFTWSMPDRYGIDTDLDGLVDLPNTAAYVHGAAASSCNPRCPRAVFPVRFEADLGAPPGQFPLATYEWTLDPHDGPTQRHTRRTPGLLVDLPEGRVDVTLSVVLDFPSRGLRRTTTGSIQVRDILIVAIGDSYASGEGNPERRRDGATGPSWGDGAGDDAVTADHAAARRSSLAWPSQVALDFERADPTSSVTFVSVAASSATVDRGLLGPQNERLPLAQIPRVADLVGERHIDLLVITIGGNDIGFSRIIAGLVDADPWLDPICYENDLRNIWDSVRDGRWDRASRLSWRITDPFRVRCTTERVGEALALPGLDGLGDALDRLAVAVAGLDPGRVVLMEYPDPTGYSSGGVTVICDEIVGDAAPLGFHEINRSEQRLGRSEVLTPLNTALSSAALRHGWTYVSGVVDAFTAGHGYCAPWPDYRAGAGAAPSTAAFRDLLEDPDAWYRNGSIAGTTMLAGAVSWYRTAGQSVVLQGPDSRVDTTGTLHPNELGHRAMADLAVRYLGLP